ncbi:MAG: FAD/NAD(P)-binding oxidoreductase [Gammaproteobacteria bacterium]|nr:FAD/NAD(P)-binding oxidoreductase [Gammaproteobacteria bacterium]
MNHLIIGAGPAGVVAAETLRGLDSSAAITVLGDEPEPPYSRMAIPYLLRENIDERGTYLRKQDDHFDALNIEVRVGRAQAVDAAGKRVKLAGGDELAYDKLLVASGSKPLTPPIPGINHARVSSCWTLQDARAIAAGIQPGAPVVLIGAGFIGCIILEALVAAGAQLTVIEMGTRMVPRMLDSTCGGLLQKWCEGKGVTVLTGAQVSAIEEADGDALKVRVDGDGEKILDAELVISATGVRANADCLGDGGDGSGKSNGGDGAGIELRDGAVVVDAFMASSNADIFAAGDVAGGKDFSTGEYSVQAIQPVAVEHARIAAHNMHAPGAARHRGAVAMNVLDTIGLVSTSYGLWDGVDSCKLVDESRYRYLRLCFEDDILIGANTLGMTEHIGILRGLIQGRFRLGKWKARLMENPLQLMESYLAATQGA